MSSQSSKLQQDLAKIQQLDPYQTQGLKTLTKVSIPMNIIYKDEMGGEVSDQQNLTIHILTKVVKGPYSKGANSTKLDQIRLFITSQSDLYLNFVSNCTEATFEGMRQKNGLNIHFNDFPNVLVGILNNCKTKPKSINEATFHLSYEGTAKLIISQQTEYKNLELVQFFFATSNVQRTNQSIIYRLNYQATKLQMMENTIKSIYQLLEHKNPPLLQFIQKNVGINQ